VIWEVSQEKINSLGGKRFREGRSLTRGGVREVLSAKVGQRGEGLRRRRSGAFEEWPKYGGKREK